MKYSFLIFLFFLNTSCVHTGYVYSSRSARHDFEKGRFDDALQWYQKQKPPARDQLLYLLDQGIILHTAGRYQESIAAFKQAMDFTEEREGAQTPSKTVSIVTNDNLIPYQGEKFERLLIHVFQVLNYIGLGQNQEALIEIRRINTKFSDFQNTFASYLSGLTWESEAKINDAYIDYKKTYRLQPAFKPLAQDLLKGSYLLGFLSDYARWKKTFGESFQEQSPHQGEVVVLIEEGTVPEKKSTEEEVDLQILPLPTYPENLDPPEPVHIWVNEKEWGLATTLNRVDETAKKTLADQKPAMIARGIARLAAKEAGAVIVGEKIDRDLGIFLGILLLATNRADLRSWLTLPRSFQVARLKLPEGSHAIELKWHGGHYTFTKVSVKEKRMTFLIHRAF